MRPYPDYVYQTLARARDIGQWYCGQADAAALCFDVLALFPDCREASDLVYELFCDEWTIYDNRVAIQRQVEEWDDRPSEQRRRLALSFRFMSRWEGWRREYEDGRDEEREGTADVFQILEDGKMELITAYCLGDEECTDYAWTIFAEALQKTSKPETTLLWIGKQYANLGFFADAAEVLGELCSRFHNPAARRLLAEVIWWRDNAHRIPWIPPAGNGSRYDRIIKIIDPEAPTTQEQIARFRSENHIERAKKYKPSIAPHLAHLFAPVIPEAEENPAPSPVDWSFLDADDGQPGEPADWVKKQMKLMRREFQDEDMQEVFDEMMYIHRWTRNIPPPAAPPKRDPNEPPFVPPIEFFDDMDDEDDDAQL
ncbi:MAG: hypothetical protein OHK0041_06310 [Anaerolineales bacterium]